MVTGCGNSGRSVIRIRVVVMVRSSGGGGSGGGGGGGGDVYRECNSR